MNDGTDVTVPSLISGTTEDIKDRGLENVGTSKETMLFNIGGVTFETYRSTLLRLPNSPLDNDTFLEEHYRPEKNDYFFDRDPDIFKATLNYLRTGELHIPSCICGPATKIELGFWGVIPNEIERCCRSNYNEWNSTLNALDQLENDRQSTGGDPNKKKTWWNTHQPKIWNYFNGPDTYLGTKLYGFVTFVFILLSIFTFVAGTTSCFQYDRMAPMTENDSDEMTHDVMDGSTTETNERLINNPHPSLLVIDIVCLVFFTVDYIIRLIFAPKRLQFICSFIGVVDLMAILPDYIDIVSETIVDSSAITTLRIIRLFRTARILRLFRLMKHVPGMRILVYTLKASVGELVLLACFMTIGVLVFSSLVYLAEERENFENIQQALWWAIVTMTTVGYGDLIPMTALGKLVGSLCAMSGLLMFALFVSALVNNFMLYHKRLQFALQAEGETAVKGDKNSTENRTRITSTQERTPSEIIRVGGDDDSEGRRSKGGIQRSLLSE